MATAPNLYFPSYSYERAGADQQDEKNSARRVANRDALLKMSEEAAAQGQSLTIEDLMRQSQATMGFNDFLRSTSPSVDMMHGIVQNQNAKAAQVAEERRRTQFQADATEEKAISDAAKGLFLAGRPVWEVEDELKSRFTPERVAKLRPQFDRIGGMAQHEAMKSGMEIGKTRFQNEFEAKEYVAKNSWLPKPEADGILIGARNNQSAVEKSIMEDALKRGSTGGWRGTAEDALLAQTAIENLAPTLPSERKAEMAKRYLETAGSAAKQFESASDYGVAQKGRERDVVDASAARYQALTLDAKDQEQRVADGERKKQAYVATLKTQFDFAKELDDKKHKDHGLGASSLLRSHYFDDPNELLKALRDGDTEKLAQIKARAVPINQYMAKADSFSSLISGAHKSDLPGLYTRMGEFGVSDGAVMAVGKELSRLDKLRNVQMPAPVASAQSQIDDDPYGLNPYAFLANGGSNKPRSSPGADDKDAAKRNAYAEAEARVKSDFISNSAEYLKEIRQAITLNGRVAATPEQIQVEEQKVALKRASMLVKGMGLSGPAAESAIKDFASQILSAAGTSDSISIRPGFGDMYREANERFFKQRNIPESGGVLPPGSLRPVSNNYPPANF